MSELRRSVAARVDYAAGPRSAMAILLLPHLWMADMCAQTLMIPRSFGSETGRLLNDGLHGLVMLVMLLVELTIFLTSGWMQ